MLHWSVSTLVAATLLFVLSFGVLSGPAQWIMWMLFVLVLLLIGLSLIVEYGVGKRSASSKGRSHDSYFR